MAHTVQITVVLPKRSLIDRHRCPYCGRLDLRPNHVNRRHPLTPPAA